MKPSTVPTRESSGRLARARLLAQVYLPGPMTVSLPGLDALVVRSRVVASEAAQPWIQDTGRSCERVSLECSASSGALIVERGLALGLVSAVLGLPTPVVIRPLSRIERGILEGMIAALLSRLALAPAIRLIAGDRAVTELASFSIGISAEMRGLAGQALLCGTEEFFERAWAARGAALEAGKVLAALRVEVAHTRLSRSELDALSEGDAIVFEEFGALLPSDPWPVQVRLGEVVVPARAFPNGSITLEDGFAAHTSHDARTQFEVPAAGGVGLASELATQSREGSVSVEITAELGTIRIEEADRAGLLRDLSFGTARPKQAHLMIGETSWAEGEILALEGEFAVQVTRKLAG